MENADLDMNGDGRVSGGDAGLTIESLQLGGSAKASLVIDFNKITADWLKTPDLDQNLNLFGILALGAGDFA